MKYSVSYGDKKRYVDDDILHHLSDLGVMQAFEPSETGIVLTLISLSKGEKAYFESEKHKEIVVERIN